MSRAFSRTRRLALCAIALAASLATVPAATTTPLVSSRTRPATRSTLWCVAEGESAAGPATLSPGAWKDLKGAGIEGVVLEGHSGIVVAQIREAGLETTTAAALRSRNDAAFTSTTLEFLRGAGQSPSPSAYSRALLNLQKLPHGPAVVVPGDALIREIAGEVFHPHDAAQTDLGHETLAAIADTILVTIPGDVAWPQPSVQKCPSSTASRRLLAMRRVLLGAHRTCAALREGILRTLVADDQDQVLAFARIVRGSSAAMVIVNNTERQRQVAVPGDRLIALGTPEGVELKLVPVGEDSAPPGRVRVSPTSIRVTRSLMEVNLAPRTAALFVTEK